MICIVSNTSLGIGISLLDDDEEEKFIGSNEDLLSFGADSEEGHDIVGVDVAHHTSRLDSQVRDVVGNVLRGGGRRWLVPLGNDSSLLVNNQKCAHT